jgi:ribose 5-phosphate isomerase B
MKQVLTVADLEGVAQGGEITVTAGAIVTPLAREEAERRGIAVRIVEGGGSSASHGGSPGSPDAKPSVSAKRIVALGADHGGYKLKEQLAGHLRDWGYAVLDLGTSTPAPVDYPDFAEAVAAAVTRGDACYGVVIDSAVIGSAIAANKVPGARAALCYDRATARNSREHNDANMLSLGARFLPPESAREILAVWLQTPFAGGRHQGRVDKICAIERRYAAQPSRSPDTKFDVQSDVEDPDALRDVPPEDC